MGDAESPRQVLSQLSQEGVAGMPFRHDQMAREGDFRRARRPDVQIVHALDARPADQDAHTPAGSIDGRRGCHRHAKQDSRSRPQAPTTITALTGTLTTGSSQTFPVNRITKPATTTPAATRSSEAMWTNAARKLMSPLPPANIPGRYAVDDDSNHGDDHHCFSRDRFFPSETSDRFPGNRPDGHHEEHRVEQRGDIDEPRRP